jgi:hypothetical protein
MVPAGFRGGCRHGGTVRGRSVLGFWWLALLLIGFIVFVVVEDTRRGLHSDSDVWLVAAGAGVAVVFWLIRRACDSLGVRKNGHFGSRAGF